jgi:transcriptional antiterminator
MNKKYWLVCNQCGYVKEIFSEQEIYDSEECFLCGGKMTLDLNQGKQIKEKKCKYNETITCNREKCENCLMTYIANFKEPTGDNFPKIPNDFIPDKNTTLAEQEIINSINMIGQENTWNLIEEISDAKTRIKYRNIFFKYGGKIPERN